MTARTRTFGLVAIALSLIAGCSSDGGGADETLPPIATSSSLPPIATAAPTVATAPVTVAPTAAPTTTPTTIAPTTSTSSTTSSSTTSTTTPPRGTSLVLRDNSIGDAVFGADPDEVIAYIRSILGAPTADTGWADPFSAFGVCPGTEVRGVSWGDLTLLFSDESIVTSGRRHFFTYSYGPPFGPSIDPAGPRTATGISVGSTVAELRAAYPGVIVNPADDIFDANFFINDGLTGFLSGGDDTDTVISFTGGIGCGE